MEQTVPLVSVILPTYNREAYLQAAVQSVAHQTLSNWELIIIDDGSSDGTRSYLSGFTDSRLHVIAQAHGGNIAALRNTGMRQAAGKYLAFLDSDDLWMPEKLQVQIDRLRRDGRARWSYTHYDHMDHYGQRLPGGSWTPHSGFILDQLLTYEATVALPTVVVEKALLQAVGGFDETLSFCEDYELWFRLAAASPVLAVSQALSRIRKHAGNYYLSDLDRTHRIWADLYERLAATGNARIRMLSQRMQAFHIGYLQSLKSGSRPARLRPHVATRGVR